MVPELELQTTSFRLRHDVGAVALYAESPYSSLALPVLYDYGSQSLHPLIPLLLRV